MAGAAGVVAGGGNWQIALVLVVVPVFAVVAVAAPERTTLLLIALLPFSFYPATVGGFSLFLAAPAFGFVSIVLLTRAGPALAILRHSLPLFGFGVLVAAAVAAAALASDSLTAFSRVLYLLLFGLFAFALATAITRGRLSREAVAKALLVAGALAGAAVTIQFLAQFAVGEARVMDWLFDRRGPFGAERVANVRQSNWVVTQLDIIRGIFPFMTPASAGQFLMFSLIAGVWLRRERRAVTSVGSTLELALLIVVGAALLFTFSRQAWIGAALGIVALGIGRRSMRIAVLAVVLALVVALIPIPGGSGSFADYLLTASDTSSESTETRLELWEKAITLIPEHALIGAGPGLIGTFGTSNRPFYAHNIYLDSAVEIGIPGVLALLSVFLAGLSAAYRRGAALAFGLLSAFVVTGLFDNVLYLPRNGLALAAAFALIAGGDAVRRRPSSGRPASERSSDPALARA